MVRMKRSVKARVYHSELRDESAARTRSLILTAARRLMIERGYGAMTMQAVATGAGVALDTVYASVGRKPVLAKLLIESAISGTDEAVAAPERDYVRRVRAAKRARDKLAIYCAALPLIHERLAPIVRSIRDAAPRDATLATLWRQIAERRARNMGLFAADLIATGEVRAGLTPALVSDVLWSMNAPEFYMLLVHERGWSPEQFGAWLSDAWARLLLGR